MRFGKFNKKTGSIGELTPEQKVKAALQEGLGDLSGASQRYLYISHKLADLKVSEKGKKYDGKYANNVYVAKGDVTLKREVYKEGKKPKLKPAEVIWFQIEFQDDLDELKKIDIKISDLDLKLADGTSK